MNWRREDLSFERADRTEIVVSKGRGADAAAHHFSWTWTKSTGVAGGFLDLQTPAEGDKKGWFSFA